MDVGTQTNGGTIQIFTDPIVFKQQEKEPDCPFVTNSLHDLG
jgi:hypothetical protein